MEDIAYEARSGLLQKDGTFHLSDRALLLPLGSEIAFTEIREIRSYDSPGLRMLGEIGRGCHRTVVWPRHRRAIVLTSNFYGARSVEDRSASYWPFVEALVRRVGVANPATVFIAGMPRSLLLFWLAIVAMAFMLVPLMILMFIGMTMDGTTLPSAAIWPFFTVLAICTGATHLVRRVWRNRPRRYDPRGPNGLAALAPSMKLAATDL